MAFSTSALRTKIEQTYIYHQKQFTEINVPSTLSLLSLFSAEKNIPSKTPAQHQVSDIMQIVFTFLCHIILHGVSQIHDSQDGGQFDSFHWYVFVTIFCSNPLLFSMFISWNHVLRVLLHEKSEVISSIHIFIFNLSKTSE